MAEIRTTKYRDERFGHARTDSYRFTVTSLNDPLLVALRRQAKLHNKWVRKQMRGNYFSPHHKSHYHIPELMRVAIMPRGPRREHARRDYPYSKLGMAYDSYLPQKYGTHFDVYYRPDTHAMMMHDYNLRNQFKIIVLKDALEKAERGEFVGDIKWAN